MMPKVARAVAAASAALAVVAMSACAPSDGGSDAGEVTVWTLTWSESEQAVWDSIVEAFEEEHPDITVTTETRGTDEHKDALRQSAGTSAGPDIYRYWAGSGLGGELVRAGVSADLTEYYEEYGWEDRFTDAALDGVTQYGDHHGVPFVQPGEALYYNKALFSEAGIEAVPTTYDELVEAADQLSAAGITPIEFGGTVNWDVMRLLDSLIELRCGADTADELNKGDGDWAEESCVTEAFTDLKEWGDEYILEGFMALSNEDSETQFFAGEVAMALEGTWFEGVSLDNGMASEDLGIFPFPTGTGRLYGFGENFYVSEASENKDAAAMFLDFFTSEEGQAIADGAWSRVGVYRDVDTSAGTPLTADWVELFDSAGALYTNNDQNFSTTVTQEYWRIQNAVLLGEIDPADAGAQFQQFREANS
jgi:raffinose/stachyose/melibiose transport system substrate-binding protein